MPTATKKTKTPTMDGLLAKIQTTGRNLRPRMVLYGGEGEGKTSLAAQAPKPVFLMSQGETGLETLIASGQLGEVPHLPQIESLTEGRWVKSRTFQKSTIGKASTPQSLS